MMNGDTERGDESPPGQGPSKPGDSLDHEVSTDVADSYATRMPDAGETIADEGGAPSGTRFRILREHARGGLGRVFVALDRELNREVALKEIKEERADDQASRTRFLLEGEVTGGLEHPGIVPVYSLGRHFDGRPYYAMRFIRGETLHAAIKRLHGDGDRDNFKGEWTLEFRKLLTRFVAVCNALAYSHNKGVIHRDIKPDNIMLGKYGETLVVDWGLAKAVGPRWPGSAVDELPLPISPAYDSIETQQGSVVGTPRYMSPEQAAGEVSGIGPPSDIYSLGATLYSVLTGQPPFQERDLAKLLGMVRHAEFLPPSGVDRHVPKGLEAICLKAMSLAPADRYASATDLAEDVERFLADEPVLAWREPWTIRARRWMRGHGRLVAGAAAGLLVAVLAGSVALATNRARGLDLVDRLQSAEIGRVLAIVDDLRGHRFWADPKLVANLAESSDDTPEKLRIALGLLPVDPRQVDYLAGQILRPWTDDQALKVLRDALGRGHLRAVADWLWSEMDRGDGDSQFRASCVLASYAGDDPRWDRFQTRTVEQLMALNGRDPMAVGRWAGLLEPVMPRLVSSLVATYSNPHTLPTDRALAARLLVAHAERPEHLANLIQVAQDRDYEDFLARLKTKGEPALDLLRKAVAAHPGRVSEADREALAHRQANAAVALARLDPPTPAWPLLKHGPDPTLRSWLIERLAPLGLPSADVERRITEEEDVSARRALLLSLGQYAESQFPISERLALADELGRLYQADPDPGIHSAIDWLLRSWKLDKGLRDIDGRLAGKPPTERSWFVNPQGQTFAVIRAPSEFLMGSPEVESDHQKDEVLHRRLIDRSFAIATTEVTVAQFQRFLDAYPQARPGGETDDDSLICVGPDQPKNAMNWFLAALYCRWLSELERLPEDQMCYPTIREIVDARNSGKTLKLPENYLRRTGYRLPTEAEWEYACRSGTTTGRPYGVGERLLSKYAWNPENSAKCFQPVGKLKPNDFGLFDILGNVRECCQPPFENYKADAARPKVDEDFQGGVVENTLHPLRGGSSLDSTMISRSAFRNAGSAGERLITVGIRPVRTIP
jgi:formylglycine-generating enzyme required for sulfatase activity/tRNA A-37 threonylcarbamoyl transferase component Bud32